MNKKITWLLLTYNRLEITKQSVQHNLKNAGREIDEIIWVDNGSVDTYYIDADVTIINKKNLGVAKGYNRGFAMAAGDYIIITGSDTLMPDNWANIFLENAVNGIACMTSKNIEKHDAVGPKIIDKRVFTMAGYIREDFGLYGYDDVEWGLRVQKEMECIGFKCDFEHLGTEAIAPWSEDSLESKEYHKFKRDEIASSRKWNLLKKCKEEGYKYYNPYL
jgi:glycosyltransferase involved in cell wall biosynthesis